MVALAVGACCLAWTVASASAAEVSGIVFNDFNTNGHFDSDQTFRDVGLPGFTIRAFTGTNTQVGVAVSGAGGHYTLDLPNAHVRLELTVTRPFWPSRMAEGGTRSDVQFVNATSAQTGVNFAVHRPDQFSVPDPTLFWATQWAGPPIQPCATPPPARPNGCNPNSHQIAIRGAPYSSKRTAAQGV